MAGIVNNVSGLTIGITTAGNTIAFTDSGDYLRINRGSQIIADGLSSAPITFTGFTDAVSHTAGAFDVAVLDAMRAVPHDDDMGQPARRLCASRGRVPADVARHAAHEHRVHGLS